MTFAFPAYHHKQCVAPATPELRAALVESFDELGWPIHSVGPCEVTASTEASLFSGGERIFVRFLKDGVIDFTSRCAHDGQCVDWGKNRDNLVKLFTALRRRGVSLPRPREASAA